MRLTQSLTVLSVCTCIGLVQTQTGDSSSVLAAVSTPISTEAGTQDRPAKTSGAAAHRHSSGWIWSVPGDWVCRHDVDCSGKPEPGTSIRFSSKVASDSNGRTTKDRGRRIVDHRDEVTPIYGYVRGQYAQGCKITKVGGGDVLIEQWKYGSDTWERHWLLQNGQSFKVSLKSPENAVQIVSNDYTTFAVTISDCSLASYALDVGRSETAQRIGNGK